jgi:hypothetical protein
MITSGEKLDPGGKPELFHFRRVDRLIERMLCFRFERIGSGWRGPAILDDSNRLLSEAVKGHGFEEDGITPMSPIDWVPESSRQTLTINHKEAVNVVGESCKWNLFLDEDQIVVAPRPIIRS